MAFKKYILPTMIGIVIMLLMSIGVKNYLEFANYDAMAYIVVLLMTFSLSVNGLKKKIIPKKKR